jgi:agmatine deiminase
LTATDAAAKDQLKSFFPGRDVHMLDASTLWSAGGGIHCVINDQPQ